MELYSSGVDLISLKAVQIDNTGGALEELRKDIDATQEVGATP